MRQAIDAWNRGDLDAYLESLYAPEIVFHGVGAGQENVEQFYRGFWEAFPGIQLFMDDVLAAEDKVAVRFHVEGRHTGSLMGLPPTGKQVTMAGITIMRFADGRCAERWSQADMLGLLQQLGAVPTAG